VTCLVTSKAMEDLGCYELPRIVHILLQHEAMVTDEQYQNGPQDLKIVYLSFVCIDKLLFSSWIYIFVQ